MPYLQPSLTGRELTVDAALKTPRIIAARIAKLVDAQLALPLFTHQLGAPTSGGGLIFSTIDRDSYYTIDDAQQRGPGDEYPVLRPNDLEPKLALVEDYGGKVPIPDEVVIRNNVSYFDQVTTQLSNVLLRKLDSRLFAKLDAAITGENIVPGHSWAELQLVGDPATLTPSAELPTADIAGAQFAADLQELGIIHDTLVVAPQEAFSLRSAYADKLDDMLKSAGVEMVVNTRVAPGTAWALQKGQVGTVAFEVGLTVDVIPDPERRRKILQAFVVPAIAIDKPSAAKKITGLAA